MQIQMVKILNNGLYVDEGISGTSLRNRRAFQQMIADAELSKFSMIYVEDISRFSRDVETGIKTVKDLRTLGVGVFFRKRGWDTLTNKNDLEFTMHITFLAVSLNNITLNVLEI